MKAYLITTGSIFALLGAAHLLRTAAEWRRLGSDLGFVVEGPVVGLCGAALGWWAWRLLRRRGHSPGS